MNALKWNHHYTQWKQAFACQKNVQEAGKDFTTFDFTWHMLATPAPKKPVLAANEKPVMARKLPTRSLYCKKALQQQSTIYLQGNGIKVVTLWSLCAYTQLDKTWHKGIAATWLGLLRHTAYVFLANLQQRQQSHQAEGFPSKSHVQLNLSSAPPRPIIAQEHRISL